MKKLVPILFLVAAIVGVILLTGCKTGVETTLPGEKVETHEEASKQQYPRVRGIDVFYCEGLGYKYDYRQVDDRKIGYCVMPGGFECEAFDFISGDCGHQYTLCEIKGYTLKKAIEDYGNYSKSYAVCVFADGSYCTESDFFNRD
ncbi:DUF333 domain-containing protein, partial [Candidatus Woesearchaeota archaeon]|nr:DUF333 domain-containing protein [Candidatus Woesearchaeota archaeon]